MPSYSTPESVAIKALLNAEEFQIPVTQDDNDYFPDYLKTLIEKYLAYFDAHLIDKIQEIWQGQPESKAHLIKITHGIATGIINAVNYYYEGKIHNATDTFNSVLNEIEFGNLTIVDKIDTGKNFYRARRSDANKIKRADIFHNPFEKRQFVNTSRYSVPGLPALYLGGSVYVCWEEFDRPPIKDIFFSRFSNKTPLNIIKIQRFDDFFKDLPSGDIRTLDETTFILMYVCTFPLSIACSIKTKEAKGSFKPEYIIPQLLLQYVADNEEIDGILFPSTKVDYKNVDNVSSYNYVFPVKHVAKKGFCTNLLAKFELTEPTSLELEALIHYSEIKVREAGYVNPLPGSLTIVEGVDSPYIMTSFGRIEETLIERTLASPTN
ncbi:hypothetical protein [uncultured Hymenobacter sp.]|uniref:hypothetical protein n=1 Tax=uncultured Hymenobacter sp. TaxID=170016 RepID=UPI0035CA3E4C